MKILITGGAGFIGSHVADACLDAGHRVLVLDNLSSGHRENVAAAATFAEGDICDADFVDRTFAEFAPDVVVHQAAQASVAVSAKQPVHDAEVNIVGSLRLLQASVQSGVRRFVFASTGGAIYGEVPEGERADVSRPGRPVSPYACSKYATEAYLGAYLAMHKLDYTILRYSNVYGPRQDPHGEAGVVAIFTERLLAGQPVAIYARANEGDDGCVRDYVYVGDVVKANLLAIDKRLQAPIVNVCTGQATTTMALARQLEKLIGKEASIGFGPTRLGDIERSVLQPDAGPLAETATLEQGLAETVSWFRDK